MQGGIHTCEKNWKKLIYVLMGADWVNPKSGGQVIEGLKRVNTISSGVHNRISSASKSLSYS